MIFLALALPARANTEYVANGDFNTLTNGEGQLGYNTDATGWTTTGYNFVFLPGDADTAGSLGQYGTVMLWGPNDGSANGLPASSPDGQNFVAADGSSDVLSFLASGAPQVPPFLLLSGVSMTSSVPEPGTVSLLLVGLGLIGGGGMLRAKSRRRGAAVARLMGPGTSTHC